MKVIDLIKNSKEPVFSFEILPPLKGNSIQKVYHIIDKLREFDPKYINITSHHSEIVYLPQPDGNLKKTTVRKRPGTVAIAAAIQNKYGIQAVPHIICKGFTKEETEYALLDLNFLGINNLLLLRGDSKPLDIAEKDLCLYHGPFLFPVSIHLKLPHLPAQYQTSGANVLFPLHPNKTHQNLHHIPQYLYHFFLCLYLLHGNQII